MNNDWIVVGSGLTGSIIARIFANAGKRVKVIEKRSNIAGNVFDTKKNNVLVHLYGPHIFHTNNEEVMKFMKPFWKLNDFKNKVSAKVNDQIIPLPFNFVGIETFWPNEADEIKNKLLEKYGIETRVSIFELLENDDPQLKKVANFIYKNVFENYTTKAWGLDPSKINKSVLKRVPIVVGYNERYFSDKFEGIPKEGFTTTIKNILNHPNIKIELNKNIKDVLKFQNNTIFFEEEQVNTPIVCTAPIDEMFQYKYGALPYRSLDIKFHYYEKDFKQKTAVLNLPADPIYTRTTEYKHMTKQKILNKTIISSEEPGEFNLNSKKFNEPFYPIPNDNSKQKYEKYLVETKKFTNLFMAGRMGTYRYINMDQAIAEAIELGNKILSGLDGN